MEEVKQPKKEVPLVFKNKKEAVEAFKALLKEKVTCYLHIQLPCVPHAGSKSWLKRVFLAV